MVIYLLSLHWFILQPEPIFFLFFFKRFTFGFCHHCRLIVARPQLPHFDCRQFALQQPQFLFIDLSFLLGS